MSIGERPRRLACVLVLLACTVGYRTGTAEIYMGIKPYQDLSDVKGLFPGADFEWIKPAWAGESDRLCRITGLGISGIIVVKFDDPRPSYRQMLERLAAARNPRVAPDTSDERLFAFWRAIADASDDEALDVAWVRFIPDAPVPLVRLKAKYGAPDSVGYRSDDFQPFREWRTRGVTAYLDDDQKAALSIEFQFTESDKREGWVSKHGSSRPYPPDALKRFRSRPKQSQ